MWTFAQVGIRIGYLPYSYIEKIDQAVKDEGENPVWILTEDRMREIMEGKDWVADDPNH